MEEGMHVLTSSGQRTEAHASFRRVRTPGQLESLVQAAVLPATVA